MMEFIENHTYYLNFDYILIQFLNIMHFWEINDGFMSKNLKPNLKFIR